MGKQELYSAYLEARLCRAKKRMYEAETDLEYENNRQAVLALEALLKYEMGRAA